MTRGSLWRALAAQGGLDGTVENLAPLPLDYSAGREHPTARLRREMAQVFADGMIFAEGVEVGL
jgi:hypothetical protein